jgi:lysophospholipase L1-like esterase
MIKHIITTATVTATALLLSSCGQKLKASIDNRQCPLGETSTDVHTSSLPTDLQVFGDSHAAGYSSCDSLEADKVTKGFAVKLAQRLNVTLDNRAVGGSTLAMQAARIQQYATRYTTYKLLMAGFNDAYYDVAIDTFKGQLRASITTMASHADQVIIATPPHYYAGYSRFNLDTLIPLYRDAVIEVVAELNLSNVTLVDVTPAFHVDSSVVVSDNVHFNAKGSAILADMFLQVMQ